MLRVLIMALWAGSLPFCAVAQERLVRLYAPQALVETGLFKYVLPRFSLKNQIAVRLVMTPEETDARIGTEGVGVFVGLGQTWRLAVQNPDHDATQRFAQWLGAEIGQKTVMGFAPDGKALFGPVPQTRQEPNAPELTGDPALGRVVARDKCIRCHVIDPETRNAGIGSTPSFSVLRSLPDWKDRIASFYALNPHPSFTVVPGVTQPFDVTRPPPISPIVISTQELEAILAFVSGLQAADLGKDLQHQ